MNTPRRALVALPVAALLGLGLVAAPGMQANAAPSSGAKQFHRLATYPVYLNLPADVPAESETVAEISDVTPDGKTLIYTDALGKRIGFLDISDPSAPVGDGSIDLTELGHADDQPTSVAVVGAYVLVVVDQSGGDFVNPSGRLDIVRISDRTVVRSIDLGGQPDSIDISHDGKYAAVAIENQRDEEFTPDGKEEGDLPQLPSGFVQIIDLKTSNPDNWAARKVDLPEATLAAAGITEPSDAEPEYVSINGANKLALTLQENNGVVIIDLRSGAIDKVFSAGTADLDGIDTEADGFIDPTGSKSGVPREPDAIGWVDNRYVATANEGDWIGGTRGWSIFDTRTGNVVWDAGTTLESLAIQYGLHNDDRNKKGTEIEGLAIAEIGGTRYAFAGSERSNFVAVYDLSKPTKPVFKQILPTTNGPEGLLPIPGRNLLAVSSEEDDASVNVRSSVNLFKLEAGAASTPTIRSANVDGQPIGWTALGALSAKPGDPKKIYAASDNALLPAQIFSIDVTKKPALITSTRTITEGGVPATDLDVEGVYARPGGGFWLANEGATGPGNQLIRTNTSGAILERVSLPADVTSHIRNWGLEGVTATRDKQGEHVFVVVQRPLWVDPTVGAGAVVPLEGANTTRIGRYDVATGTWTWFGYQLEDPIGDGIDWVGLSEVVAVDLNTLAVIERDKLNGVRAVNKRIYTVDLPQTDPAPGTLPILKKKLAYDVLPALRATNGWTQEKLEGLTIGADRKVYAITDNDAVQDATGETVFLRLGSATSIFGGR